MDSKTAREAPAAEFGKTLKGFGVNLLARDVRKTTDFLKDVLGMKAHRSDKDFAVLEHRGEFFQVHADHTYHENPLSAALTGAISRGVGVELRLYELDPDQCEARAENAGYTVLRASLDRPHGLRECYLLDPDGYCWVPSIPVRD